MEVEGTKALEIKKGCLKKAPWGAGMAPENRRPPRWVIIIKETDKLYV